MIEEIVFVEGEKRDRPELIIMQSIYDALKKYKLRHEDFGKIKVTIKIEKVKNV